VGSCPGIISGSVPGHIGAGGSTGGMVVGFSGWYGISFGFIFSSFTEFQLYVWIKSESRYDGNHVRLRLRSCVELVVFKALFFLGNDRIKKSKIIYGLGYVSFVATFIFATLFRKGKAFLGLKSQWRGG
jgi:hypothetical protein